MVVLQHSNVDHHDPQQDAGSPPGQGRLSPGRALLHRDLPILSVEWFGRNRSKVDIVETAHVDVDLVRIGARHGEWMYPAVFAKRVLCGLGVELVSCQIVLATDKLELT